MHSLCSGRQEDRQTNSPWVPGALVAKDNCELFPWKSKELFILFFVPIGFLWFLWFHDLHSPPCHPRPLFLDHFWFIRFSLPFQIVDKQIPPLWLLSQQSGDLSLLIYMTPHSICPLENVTLELYRWQWWIHTPSSVVSNTQMWADQITTSTHSLSV